MTDGELLRRFEPILRFTRGEFFFPMSVDPYLAACDLWATSASGRRRQIADVGEVRADNLAAWKSKAPGEVLSLRYVQEPHAGGVLRRASPRRDRFSAPSRLSRVGVLARLVDAGFDLSLLFRGSVPGGTVGAAEEKYAVARQADPAPRYYGRVVRQGAWIVCHYLFFYAMNDWRTSFAGANDHEADWEQCFVFVEETAAGEFVPVWFAVAAHDRHGADLRRRWDDPALQLVGEHPIVFVGAGSHAAYIEPGEYLQEVPLRLPGWLRATTGALNAFWRETLRQGSPEGDRRQRALTIAFVDYARGDGLSVGDGQETPWSPSVIDDETGWARDYDGLFGLDTRDRFAGERAPAGPRYERAGLPRTSWIDPLGFVGLVAEPPPSKRVDVLEAAIADLSAEAAVVQQQIGVAETSAQRWGVRGPTPGSSGRDGSMAEPVANLSLLRRRLSELLDAIRQAQADLERLAAGDLGDPRAHLRSTAVPEPTVTISRSRLVDLWSAIGVAAGLVVLGALIIIGIQEWWLVLPLIVFGYAVIEAVVRSRLLQLLLNITVVLAAIGALILLVTHWLAALAISVAIVGVVILRDNLGELR